jgi:SAM-dependent methyltransferase
METLSTQIRILIDLYHSRTDLQQAFPEVSQGDLSRLFQWVREYGLSIDAAREILLPHAEFFREQAGNPPQTGHFWDDSVQNYIRNGFKIYWETLEEIGAYQFECITADPRLDLLSYSIDMIRSHFGGRPVNAAFVGCDELNRTEVKLWNTGIFSNIVVMDIAAGLLDRQREKARQEQISGIEYRAVDCNLLVAEPGAWDVVFAMGTIHHIKELEHFFAQLKASMRPGGLLFMREFTGPDYLQYTDLQLKLVNSLLAAIPEEYRRYPDGSGIKETEGRIDLNVIMQMDPTESVRSSQILRILQQHFKIRHHHKTGGTLLMPLLSGIAGNFERDEKGRGILKACIGVEKELMKAEMIPSDFVYIIAEPI